MKLLCRSCNTPFIFTKEDQDFYDKAAPVFGGIKIPLPRPTLCPADRKRRRLSFRNERTLYRRRCDLSGKEIISMYPQTANCTVYETELWHSDKWDAQKFGREVDLNRSFIDQIGELLRVVPLESLFSRSNENSPYVNLAGSNKNCHLIFNSNFNEGCQYCRGTAKSRDCLDMYFGVNNELCYECVNCHDCYALTFSQNCTQCRDSAFLFNCSGCNDCFGCCNLIQKQFCLYNEQLSEGAYREFIAGRSGSPEQLSGEQRRFGELKHSAIHRASQSKMSENCSGDYLANSKNCRHCFEVHAGVDCAFVDCARFLQDCQDVFGFGVESELLLETVAVGFSNRVLFSCYGSNLQDVYYSHSCHHSKNLFGCVSVIRGAFCILNRQYSAEDYQTLVSKIVQGMIARGEWGEFFKPQLSHFGYDESQAQEYFPLNAEQAKAAGFNWSGLQPPVPQAARVLKPEQLRTPPHDLTAAEIEELLASAVTCESSGRLFRFTRQELEFYTKLKLPLPRRHPEQRHLDRVRQRGRAELQERECAKCSRPVQTGLRKENCPHVYCEDCYRELVH